MSESLRTPSDIGKSEAVIENIAQVGSQYEAAMISIPSREKRLARTFGDRKLGRKLNYAQTLKIILLGECIDAALG